MRTVGMVFLVAVVVLAAALESAPAQATGQQWQWMERTFSGPGVQNPSVRYTPAMAYDTGRNVAVFFGGHYPGYYYNDTWERDMAAWLPCSPKTNPAARCHHALAYDAARVVTVLFGGWNGSTLADTWIWDGVDWKNVTPKTGSPLARYGHSLAYDPARKRVVLFGGYDGTNYLNDTWEWDGTSWTQINTQGPTARFFLTMVYDSSQGCTILFGGCGSVGGSPVRFGDTWKYDGQVWSPVFVAGPNKRGYHAMAFDTNRNVAVLFGGRDGSVYYSDTWEFDGQQWTQRKTPPSPSRAPSARYGVAMVYDAVLQQPVLFGGYNGSSYLNDTWDYYAYNAPECMFAGKGHGGGGLGLKIHNNTRPVLGTTFQVTFQNSQARIPGSGFNLLSIGFPLASAFTIAPPAVVDNGYLYGLPLAPALQLQGNPVVFPLPIPNNPYLKGAKFCLQGGSFESSGGFRLTDAIEVTIQDK